MARVLSAAEVTVCRGANTLRTMKRGETNAAGTISKLLNKFGPETVISALQCITQTGSGNPGFLRAMIMEPLCAKSKMERFRRTAATRDGQFRFHRSLGCSSKRATNRSKCDDPDVDRRCCHGAFDDCNVKKECRLRNAASPQNIAGGYISFEAILVFDQAASEMRISTCKPAAPIILTKVSRPNSSILPRMRSEMRGCVTPSSLAASDWLSPIRAI